MHVGVDLVCADTVSASCEGSDYGHYLLELVEVSGRLEGPQSRQVLRQLERLRRRPVFHHAGLIRRDDKVITIAILLCLAEHVVSHRLKYTLS